MRYEDANLDGVELMAQGDGEYRASDGTSYRLRAVDRDYSGRRLRPVYFLQRGGAYVSGVFQTKREGVLSIDLRDDLGVKHYFDMYRTPAGFSVHARKSPPKNEKLKPQDLVLEPEKARESGAS